MTEESLRRIAPSLPNGSAPLPGIVTAGQPEERHLEQLAREGGIRTVVDLRGANEPRGIDEAPAVQRQGMEYVHLPVSGPPTDDAFGQFRALMRDEGRKPMLVHCGTANRVGAMLLPYLVLDEGKTLEDADVIAREVGLRSPELADAARAYLERHRGG